MSQTQPTKRALRPAQVADKLGVSVHQVFRYQRENPKFPRGVKLSARVTVFDEGELDAWLESRKAAAA